MCTYLLEGLLFLEGRQNAGTKMLSLAGKHSQKYSACKVKQQEPSAYTLSRGRHWQRNTNTDACSVRHRHKQKRLFQEEGTTRTTDSGILTAETLMNKAEEHQSESINCIVRVCIAFNVVTRNILLPCYLRSSTLRAVQYSLK